MMYTFITLLNPYFPICCRTSCNEIQHFISQSSVIDIYDAGKCKVYGSKMLYFLPDHLSTIKFILIPTN